ncbi:hypothetical protein CMV_009240 [Castanea mollissima]|uniref:Uncharacterized protein n=1 Tax=Castanea mollissima TaxID=60419 RepID=A0A8J4REQ1_9ROSI|nr:hypothetical protein CMV_009240 [Castanea mollissima]
MVRDRTGEAVVTENQAVQSAISGGIGPARALLERSSTYLRRDWTGDGFGGFCNTSELTICDLRDLVGKLHRRLKADEPVLLLIPARNPLELAD